MIIPRTTISLIAFIPGLISTSKHVEGQIARTLKVRWSEPGRRPVIPRMDDVTPLIIAPLREEHAAPVEAIPNWDSLSSFEREQLRPYIRNGAASMCADYASPKCQLFRAALLPGQDWDPVLLENEAAARTVFRYLVPRIGLDESSSGDLAEFLRRTLLAKVLFVKFGVLFVGAAKAKEILDTVEPSRVIPEGLDEIMLITAARKRPLPDILAALRSVQSYSSSPMSDAIRLLGKSGERVHPA